MSGRERVAAREVGNVGSLDLTSSKRAMTSGGGWSSEMTLVCPNERVAARMVLTMSYLDKVRGRQAQDQQPAADGADWMSIWEDLRGRAVQSRGDLQGRDQDIRESRMIRGKTHAGPEERPTQCCVSDVVRTSSKAPTEHAPISISPKVTRRRSPPLYRFHAEHRQL